MTSTTTHPSVLLVGASRGLGAAIAETYVARGAHVVATVRGPSPTPVHDLLPLAAGALELEHLDITSDAELSALHARLAGRRFDLLFVVAGISTAPPDQPAADIATADFQDMMLTNALAPMRAVESLQDLVDPSGTIAWMSSSQGSIARNQSGGFEVYRASKSALNQLVRSYAARHDGEHRTLLLMAPGWVRTQLGGPGAALEIGESIPPLVDTVDAQRGIPGLRFLDRNGQVVAW